jgi:phenylalanyl-tRNA synthetase beta chain
LLCPVNFATFRKQMKISYRWLQTLFPLTREVADVAKVLTATGLEVEGWERVDDVPGGLAGCVVGQIQHCNRHPDADRLQVCLVDVGEEAPLQIVCGAANARAGLRVIVARIGAQLFPVHGDPLTIKKGKIRGVESHGMICAEDELGLGEGHEGVLELAGEWAPGTPAAEALNLGSDWVFEIGLTPNRTDAMSHWGVARDLRAGLLHETVPGIGAGSGLPDMHWPLGQPLAVTGDTFGMRIAVEDLEAAPRYLGLVLDGVKVGPSPENVQRMLRAIGVTPINNVVDATNWVLHELGTPLHAFDRRAIAGDVVRVRRARGGETLTTLDGTSRTLDPADLVIANEHNPMGLAGVFGGQHSGIQPDTTSVFLEAAWFQPATIRATAKRHGLSTDASFRFERGVDPAMVRAGLERAAKLLIDWAGVTRVSGLLEGASGTCPTATRCLLEEAFLGRILGESLPATRIESILDALDIEIVERTDGAWDLLIPSYRSDVTRPADVAEEILRIHGFDRIPLPRQIRARASHVQGPDREKMRYALQGLLVARGFSEMMNNSMTRKAYGEWATEVSGRRDLALESRIDLLNPLSSDLGSMRQSLVFQGLETIVRNRNHQAKDLRFFEIGRTYHHRSEADGPAHGADGTSSYRETEQLSLFLCGHRAPENWNNPLEEADLFTLKTEVMAMLEGLGLLQHLEERNGADGLYQEGVSWWQEGQCIGRLGAVHPHILRAMDLDAKVFASEWMLEPLFQALHQPRIQAQELPRFPAVRRDLSLILEKGTPFADIRRVAASAEPRLLTRVGLFDVYSGDKLPEGKVSYAISLTLQDASKTLTDKQIDRSVNGIRTALETELGAALR